MADVGDTGGTNDAAGARQAAGGAGGRPLEPAVEPELWRTIRDVDVVVVLDGGRVVETGSHAELLARSGVYAALWKGHERAEDAEGDTLRRALVSVPLFAGLLGAALDVIAATARVRVAEAGEEVIRAGEPGEDLFVVLGGRLQAFSDEQPRGVMGPGDYFGEFALVRDVPRTATVRALAPSRLAVIPRPLFLELLERDPAIRAVVEARIRSLVGV